ncbi:hypothetical protein [Microbacterium sp. NC79]|uniref:hypothetical protein n=1 Tax=Microbacterium sp. NC79 TaxID=2851009 RepID=UPI001C2B89CB|nr:hypothetical protein [Microbacterium sp. NC79]MBV0893714.1 hypothetical protein [Microbacterium sp. NC79]
MGWFVELISTEVAVPRRRGWQPPKGSTTPLYIMTTVLVIIVGLWLGSVAFAVGSVAIALFAVSVIATIGVGIGIISAKMRATHPLRVRVGATADAVTFDAGDATRSLLRVLAPIGVVMFASLLWLIMRGELYGDSDEAVFSGIGRFGSAIFFVIAVAIIIPSIRAWRGSTGASLTLTRESVALALPRTGGSAPWASIAGASFATERVTVLANTGSFSWASRDLASDPVVLTDLITYYADNPAARASIGSGTIALLKSGQF